MRISYEIIPSQIRDETRNSTLLQFILGNHLLFVENSDIMVSV